MMLQFLLLNFSAVGQQIIKEASIISDSSNECLSRTICMNFKLEDAALDSSCLNTVVYIKFIVGKDGKIKSIQASDLTPPGVLKEATKAIKKTEGSWRPRTIDGKTTDSQPFILPIILAFGLNCRDSERKDYFRQGITNVLSYGYNPQQSIDCILLNPITAYAPTRCKRLYR